MDNRTWANCASTTLSPICAILLALVPSAFAQEEGAGYRQAKAGYAFQFPRDHGSHPKFRLEWWYLTGHLRTTSQDDRRFGFQATFFRTALRPTVPRDGTEPVTDGDFDSHQAYLAHFAIFDAKNGRLHAEERLNRQGWDAHASSTDLDVRNGNWSLRRAPELTANAEGMLLKGSVLADARLSLQLVPAKPKVIFGKDGISRKSSASDSASHYVTFTRLRASGALDWLGTSYEVEGLAWMDHEFSSSQLGPDQVGWDWASIQLNDGRDLMLYRLRFENGEIDKASQLYWIAQDATVTPLPKHQWRWQARKTWTSPATGARYPIDIEITCFDPESEEDHLLRLRPLAEAQEIVGKLDSISYWEGACDVVDESGEVVGQAYVELTGYDGQLTDRLR